jgi:hypothetical protein
MIVMAACDTYYYAEHGVPFIVSAVKQGMKVCALPIYNISKGTVQEQKEIIAQTTKEAMALLQPEQHSLVMNIHEPSVFVDHHLLNIKEERAYYASLRFLLIPKLLRFLQKPLLVVDIDSFFQKPILIEPTEVQLGIYLREGNKDGNNKYETQGMQVAAGVVYATIQSLQFFEDVSDYIKANELKWFVDQHALYHAYLKHKDTFKIKDFAKTKMMGWDLDKPDELKQWDIVTGKGARKDDPRYLKLRKETQVGNADTIQ